MPSSEHPAVLFSYCLAIDGREFLVRVMFSGLMLWDDYQARRHCCGSTAPMAGDDPFTVAITMDPALLAWFQEVAARVEAGSWGLKDEEALDERLAPLFWDQVNPHLPRPLAPPSS